MKKRFWIILLLVGLMLFLAACQKSATKNPVVTATSANVPFPTPLPNKALENAVSGTQTAVAAVGKTVPTATKAGPAQAKPTETPKAAAPAAAEATATPVPPIATATAKAVVVATSTPGKPSTYTLQKGEFPYCIARRFNVSVSDLLSLNSLSTSSHPSVGTVLKIPQSGTWNIGDRALKSHPTTYTVNSGDTIYSIACLYGDVDPNQIIAANNLSSPYNLTAGQTLNIP
jgi:LysM repeat protein